MEEVSFTDKIEVYDRLKTIISNETDEFERKFVDAETLPSPRGVILLTNKAHALHLEKDDRRFFVVDSANAPHPDGARYYERLFQMDDGVISGLYQALKQYPLAGFDSKRPPFDTAAKARMISSSRNQISDAIHELAAAEMAPFDQEIATLESIQIAVQNFIHEKVAATALKRALHGAGYETDEKARQCYLKSEGRKLRMVFLSNARAYDSYTAAELAAAYENQFKRPGSARTTSLRRSFH